MKKLLSLLLVLPLIFVSCSSDDDDDKNINDQRTITYEVISSAPEHTKISVEYVTGIDANKEETFEEANVDSGWKKEVKMKFTEALPFIMANLYLTDAGIEAEVNVQTVNITVRILEGSKVLAESTKAYATQAVVTGITQ